MTLFVLCRLPLGAGRRVQEQGSPCLFLQPHLPAVGLSDVCGSLRVPTITRLRFQGAGERDPLRLRSPEDPCRPCPLLSSHGL